MWAGRRTDLDEVFRVSKRYFEIGQKHTDAMKRRLFQVARVYKDHTDIDFESEENYGVPDECSLRIGLKTPVNAGFSVLGF